MYDDVAPISLSALEGFDEGFGLGFGIGIGLGTSGLTLSPL